MGAGEFRESGRFVGQEPLAGFGRDGHCGMLECLGELLEATCGHLCSTEKVQSDGCLGP